jgi:hypothetical protein
MTEVINQGLYLAVNVRATDEVKAIFDQVPPCIGAQLDASEAHITVAYPDDFANSGILTTDRQQMVRVGRQISRGIAELGIRGVPIAPARPEVRFFRRLVGIDIAPEDDVIQCINLITDEAVQEEFGPTAHFVPQRKRYHMTVARRPQAAAWGRNAILPQLAGPDSLLADGHRVIPRDIYASPELRKQHRDCALGISPT